MTNQASELYIYVFDNTLKLNDNGNKVAVNDDDGRTKNLRMIMMNIIDKNAVKIHVEPQVYDRDFKLCDNQKNHKDDCAQCSTNGFHKLPSPFVLFVHTSNSCSSRFIKKLIAEGNNTNCWIVCYSGGEEPDWYKEFATGFKNIRFFGGIGDDVENKWDIPRFVDAVLDSNENAFDYLVHKPNAHLIALALLCQGYLAAHEEISLLTNLGKLKGTVTSKVGITEDANWWLPVISGNTKSARDELGDRKNMKAVENLLDAIDGKDGKSLSGCDGTMIVKNAYNVLPEIKGTS